MSPLDDELLSPLDDTPTSSSTDDPSTRLLLYLSRTRIPTTRRYRPPQPVVRLSHHPHALFCSHSLVDHLSWFTRRLSTLIILYLEQPTLPRLPPRFRRRMGGALEWGLDKRKLARFLIFTARTTNQINKRKSIASHSCHLSILHYLSPSLIVVNFFYSIGETSSNGPPSLQLTTKPEHAHHAFPKTCIQSSIRGCACVSLHDCSV